MGWPFIILFFSCRNENADTVLNRPPSTKIFIESIGLPDTVRLFAQVKLNWSGFDADGYVKGYRISWAKDTLSAFNNLAVSQIVTATDSTFLFNFTGVTDIANVCFFVQAVDDKGLVDPNPAFLKIPVKNSKPTISFIAEALSTADSIWSVISLPYKFSDPDGNQTIDSIFIRINSSGWIAVPKKSNFLSLVPENPSSFGETNALVYLGENLATLNQEPAPVRDLKIPGLQINGRNKFYLKIKDFAGAVAIDSTPISYYFKRKTGDLLLIDAYKGEGAFIGDTLYTNIISGFTSFDKIDMIAGQPTPEGAGVNQPKFWNASFYLLCKLYGKVFWYSDIITNQPGFTPLLLTSASGSLIQYLRFNGKFLGSVIFPDLPNQLASDDPVFSLIPIDTITRVSSVVRLKRNNPVMARQPGFADLKSIVPPNSGVITGVDIFKVKAGVDSLYFIPKTSLTTSYFGLGLPIALRARNAFTGKTNMVFFGMEMSYLSGDRQALSNTFNKILNEEFNW